MTTTTFKIGDQFQHYNGYVWTITQIEGKYISLESENQTQGSVIKGSMTKKDLQSVISAGYYKQLDAFVN